MARKRGGRHERHGWEMCLCLGLDVPGGSIIQVMRLDPPGGGGRPTAAHGQLAWPQGAAGPWELSPLTDGWGQLPVAGHPRHEPRGHLCGRPRWPPARRLALNIYEAFCSRSRGRAGSAEALLSEEEAARCSFPLPPTPTASSNYLWAGGGCQGVQLREGMEGWQME